VQPPGKPGAGRQAASIKLQDSSNKQQALQGSSYKQQASSTKLLKVQATSFKPQAASIKLQAASSELQDLVAGI
jgi:hypothetical protein